MINDDGVVSNNGIKEIMMREQENAFINNFTLERLGRAAAFVYLGVGVMRLLANGDVRGLMADTCYAGSMLFFSRTFAQGNQHKAADLLLSFTLFQLGTLTDSNSFVPKGSPFNP